MGSLDEEDTQQGGGWRNGQSHICMQINQEEQLGSKIDHATHGSRVGKRKSQNLWL